MKAIYFDMDGTIADLYGYDGWLDMLHNEDTTPYEDCGVLVDLEEMHKVLNAFIAAGITIGVISWGAMGGTNEYCRRTRKAKIAWCEKYFPNIFTEYHVVKYGTPKHRVRKIHDSILVDDNADVRDAWNGGTIDASDPVNMIKMLWLLLGVTPPRKQLKMSGKMEKAKEQNLFSPLFEKHAVAESGLYMLGQTTFNPVTNEKRYWVKVGLTTNPDARFNSYLTHAADIYFIDYLPLEKTQIRENEQICHEFLNDLAETIRTEWFKVSSENYFTLCEKGFSIFSLPGES